MPLTSAQQFRKFHPDDAKSLERAVNESWFQRATTYVKAEIVEKGWSPEKTAGANEFMKLLNELGADSAASPTLPEKSLSTDRIGDAVEKEGK